MAATRSSIPGQQLREALLVAVRSHLQALLGELQARQVLGVAAKLDVHAAAGHVRRDRHPAGLAGLRDDLGLARGVLGLGVQDGVLDPALLQTLAQQLRDLHRDRADQHRLPVLVARRDLPRDRAPLAVLGLVDLIVAIVAEHVHVGRDLHDRQLVDLHELGRLRQRRAGHAGELVVEAEEVLVGDRRERLVLLLDAYALLRLDRLVQAFRPAPAVEDAPCELVDDLHLAVDHRVVDVALVERLRAQRLDQVVDEVPVLGAVEVIDAQEALGLGDAQLGHRDRLALLLELVVEVRHELLLGARVHAFGRFARRHPRRQARELHVQVGRLFGRARDDQRRARLVDQDVVDLVHDRERLAALDLFGDVLGHVVAQVVEAELRVGPVDHVARVRLVLLLVGLHVLQHTHRDPQRVVDRAHPFRVAAREVVVDGDHVHALAFGQRARLARGSLLAALRRRAVAIALGLGGLAVQLGGLRAGGPAGRRLVSHRQRVQHHRERRRQRLALACLHLRDAALVQRHPADQLDVEVAHAHRPLAGLAHDREALRQERVQRLAGRRARAQLVHPRAQLGVGVVFELRLERSDQLDPLLVLLELLRLAHVEGAIQDGHAPRLAPEGGPGWGRSQAPLDPTGSLEAQAPRPVCAWRQPALAARARRVSPAGDGAGRGGA